MVNEFSHKYQSQETAKNTCRFTCGAIVTAVSLCSTGFYCHGAKGANGIKSDLKRPTSVFRRFLAVIFVIKLLTSSQLYHLPKLNRAQKYYFLKCYAIALPYSLFQSKIVDLAKTIFQWFLVA